MTPHVRESGQNEIGECRYAENPTVCERKLEVGAVSNGFTLGFTACVQNGDFEDK